MAEESGREIVTVFVRRGKSENERTLSFKRPNQAADAVEGQALGRGFAFDGNSIVRVLTPKTRVGWYYEQEGKPGRQFLYESDEAEEHILRVLWEAEQMVRDWLSEQNLLVFFA